MRLTATLFVLALLLAVDSARAAETALYLLPADKLCTKNDADGRWYLDNKKLLAELIGRMVRSGEVPIDAGDDSGKISLTYSRTGIAHALWDDLADFNEHLTNTDYHIVAHHRPSAGDVRKYPELETEGGYLLFPKGRYAIVLCTKPEDEAVDKNARPLPKTVFRVRGDPTDLRNPLKDDSKPATFSITDDFEKTVTSFQIDGAVGVGVSGPLVTEPSSIGGYNVVADGQLIIYGRLDQKGADNVKTLEIDNKAIGLLANIDYGHIGGWENNISLLSAYTWDDKVDSQIETARVVWAPLPAWSPRSDFANWWLRSFVNYASFSLGNNLVFQVRNTLTGEAVYGNAVEAGTDPLFQEDKTYFQAGGVVGTSISWVDMNLLRLGKSVGLLRGMTLFAQYKWLGGISGSLDTFERFEGGVTFALGESKKFGWTTKYVKGRLDDTLQRVDYVESALSLRF
ncbi:MAG: hypothetical protein WBQ82_08660 [Methyloceanibacter sp.]